MKRLKEKSGRPAFTLVELVVVIAILGILSGVGAVAYTGYIDSANKGVDRETVGNLIYAASLADYSNPELYKDGTAMIAVTAQGTSTAGVEGLDPALADSVGELSGVKLKYGKWAGSMSGVSLSRMMNALSDTIGYLDEDGNIVDGYSVPSYAESADKMWGLVGDLVSDSANANIFSMLNADTGGEAMAEMANRTATKITQASDMAAAWAKPTQSFSDKIGTVQDASVGASACVARLKAFAEYLHTCPEIQQEDIDYINGQFNTSGFSNIYKTTSVFKNCVNGTVGSDAAMKSRLQAAAKKYADNTTTCQAYSDGLVYYSLMYMTNDLTVNGLDPNSEDYMDTIGSYVGFAGTALSSARDTGSVKEYADLVAELADYSGSIVIITVSKAGETLTCKVSPAEADPREQN